MPKMVMIAGLLIAALFAGLPAVAEVAVPDPDPGLGVDNADQAAIRAALQQWTDDFNAHDEAKVCDIFETGVLADIRTAPEQTYDVICKRLKAVVGDKTRSYSYAQPDIKEILVFGDAAVVRLVWTLMIAGDPEGPVKSVESGMDLFRRQPDGGWKIMRWMSYN